VDAGRRKSPAGGSLAVAPYYKQADTGRVVSNISRAISNATPTLPIMLKQHSGTLAALRSGVDTVKRLAAYYKNFIGIKEAVRTAVTACSHCVPRSAEILNSCPRTIRLRCFRSRSVRTASQRGFHM